MRGEPVLWHEVFGNDRRVEVEIGPGRGDVLLAFAAAAPATNFFAIERTGGAADAILARARALGLANVRVIAGDARCVVARLIPETSVAAYHLYFPDPWPKTRHRRRRLADAAMARDLARTLSVGGTIDVASDLGALVTTISAHLVAAGLARVAAAASCIARPVTVFERKYARAGTYHARLVRSAEDGRRGAPAPGVVDG
ncbi:MAG TPA: tRNA (guanosine(46)-N7)-methyltransferase TrmB [Candidatus Binatia bacterium]|nr:tRNA (guanosine(46)-N7)-methyltransferase TrmB [Candidatus Binatia bacterium]